MSNINVKSRTGTCSICGPVDIKKRSATSWRCGNKHRETQRPINWKRNAIRGGYVANDYDAQERIDRLAKQDGKCAICSTSITLSSSKMDHCHNTGVVRGLLCNHCNIMLGYAKDSISTLEAAIRYLGYR